MKTGHLEASGCRSLRLRRGRAARETVHSSGADRRCAGAPSDAVRAQDALRLLNYGFSEYDTVRIYPRWQRAGPCGKSGRRCLSGAIAGPRLYITLPANELRRVGRARVAFAIERAGPPAGAADKGETVAPEGQRRGQVLADAPDRRA